MYYSPSKRGFFDTAIHGENIPSDAVDITDSEYRALIAAQAQGKIIQPDESGYPIAVSQPAPSASEVYAAKQREIRDKSDAFMAGLTSSYSLHEKLSWPKQEAEAKALAADTGADAPLLSGLAAQRGIDVLVLRDKVLANVSAYEAACAKIIGQQQAYEDALKAAGDDVAMMQAIDPVYTL